MDHCFPSSAHRRARLLTTGCLLLFGLTLSLASASRARADADSCVSAHESAQRHRREGQLVRAREQLLSCAQPSCPGLVRNDCGAWLAEVDASLPSVVFAVASSGGSDLVEVRVYANGALLTERLDGRAIALDPGVFTLRFEAEGHAPLEQQVTIREAEKNRLLRAELQPLAKRGSAPAEDDPRTVAQRPSRTLSRRARITSFALGSVALAATGTALGFGIAGKRELDRLDARCGGACSDDETRKGRRFYVAADVAIGAAAASAIAATCVYWVARRRTAPALTLRFDRDTLGLGYAGRF